MERSAVLQKLLLLFQLIFLISPPLKTGGQNFGSGRGNFGGVAGFTTFTTEQGLALSGIASSCVDRFGNLWFGTYGGGASRFDGKSFTNFTSIEGLANNVILSIYKDRNGNLWFGTNRSGLTKYDGNKFITYTTSDGLPNNTILAITEDSSGNLWLGTYGGGAAKFDGKKFTTLDSSNGLTGDDVRSVLSDSKGNLWFGTIRHGAVRYDGKSFSKFDTTNGLPNNDVFNIIEANDGNIWFGTMGGGVSKFDGKKFINFNTKHGLANNFVWSSLKDHNGNLWFGTKGGGATCFDGKNFITFSTNEGLPNNFIYTIAEDSRGKIWFGTYGGGVSRYDGTAVTTFTTKQGLPTNFIFSILQDRRGNFWLGTYNKGLIKASPAALKNFEKKYFTFYTTSNGLSSNDVKSIYEDRAGNIWLGTIGGGVDVFFATENKFKNYSTKDGLADNKVNSIHEDRNGIFWICTAGGGVSRFDGKKFKNYSVREGLANNIVLCMIEDKKGDLWFGTAGGVSRFDGSKFTSYTTENGLARNIVFSIFQDKEENIWFGTDGSGITKYDGKSFSSFSAENGLSDNTIAQILQNEEGKVFIGTNLGLSVLTGWDGKNPRFEIYNKKTGYNIKDVNAGQRGMYLDKNGIFWIATGDDKTALIRFDYSSIDKNQTPPEILIQKIKLRDENINWYGLAGGKIKTDSSTIRQQDILAYGKSLSGHARDEMNERYSGIKFDSITSFYPVPQNLVLPHTQNHITFEYAAIEPSNSSLVHYQYMLEGYDRGWSPVTSATSASFGNMGEGKYTFRVKAQNPNGSWSRPVTYSFSVLPPWYRTYWAYFLYFLIFASLVYLSSILYSRGLKKINLQLEQTVTERTREIKLQNEELKDQASQIQLQSLKLREANASKDKFFRIIAHDLRSPIGGFLRLTELMANDRDLFTAEELTDASRNLHRSADNLYKLMNNLLEWATLQQEGIEVHYEDYNLHSIAEQNISTISERAFQKGITIENNIDESLNARTDERLINTVLRNLITNAVKFTNRGGKVTVSSKATGEEIEISVTDTGIGISEEDQKKLFKIDQKTGRKGTDNEPSSGLGLILCKEFIEKQNGTIGVESEPGRGSRFYFTLPVKPV